MVGVWDQVRVPVVSTLCTCSSHRVVPIVLAQYLLL